MRTATSENPLTSGIAYAFHPHRDTWYSAPFSQINWWLPIYDIQPSNAMAFPPALLEPTDPQWIALTTTTTRVESYQPAGSSQACDESDTRKQPKPEEPLELDPQIRLLPSVGGIILFSGAQLHSTVPNDSGRTRFSIDFRTVHYDDVVERRGAPNLDSECTGTTMRDYLRGSDLTHIPEPLCVAYEAGTPLVGAPERSSAPALVGQA
jgi:hypothetical protein